VPDAGKASADYRADSKGGVFIAFGTDIGAAWGKVKELIQWEQ
jgi:hypothetical protein